MLATPMPMHVPDGFLSLFVSVLLWTLSIVAVGYALRRVNEDLGERQVPLMGVLAAAIFAGQMLNFAVAGGTSGHLMGAALATIVLGPWAAVVVMTSVVGIQAVVFQDGGILALGANIFNMGVVGVAVAHFAYRSASRLLGTVVRNKTWVTSVSGFVAGWLSLVIAALACGLQLAASGTSPANVAIPAMGGIHVLIALGEGAITAGALAFVAAARGDLLSGQATLGRGKDRVVFVAGLSIAVLLAVLSPLASAHPDGLEWVAERAGFLDLAREPGFRIVPDYALPGIGNEAVATILAGIVGVGLVLGAVMAVGYARRRRQSTEVL